MLHAEVQDIVAFSSWTAALAGLELEELKGKEGEEEEEEKEEATSSCSSSSPGGVHGFVPVCALPGCAVDACSCLRFFIVHVLVL